MDNKIDIEDVLAELRGQIGNLSQELAIQKVLVRNLLKEPKE